MTLKINPDLRDGRSLTFLDPISLHAYEKEAKIERMIGLEGLDRLEKDHNYKRSF